MQHQVEKQLPASRDPFRTRPAFTSCSVIRRIYIDRYPSPVWLPRRGYRKHPFATANLTFTQSDSLSLWTGSDDFTSLNDRIDAPPLPLPSVTAPVRVVIVRHGQSTWNAEGRIQGSTDLSVLTEKGVKQAQKTRDMLSCIRFNRIFHSPLTRAVQTAEVVMQGQTAGCCGDASSDPSVLSPPRSSLAALREIDLYEFQGLLKHEGKALYGSQYKLWQRDPAAFELGGHAPVRELWYRASLAWRILLATEPTATSTNPTAITATDPTDPRVILVVAHNAINQALVATALGLPPSYFRRLPQNNAALSVLDFAPAPALTSASSSTEGGDTGLWVTLSCLNQSPENPFKNPDKVVASIVLLTPPTKTPTTPLESTQQPIVRVADADVGATSSGSESGAVTAAGGASSDSASPLGALAAVLGKLPISHLLVAPGVASSETIRTLLQNQQLQSSPTDQPPPPSVVPPTDSSWSSVEDTEEGNPTSANPTSANQPSVNPPSPVSDPNVTWHLGIRVETLEEDVAPTTSTSPVTSPSTGAFTSTVHDGNAGEPHMIWQRAVTLAAQPRTAGGIDGNGDGTPSYGNVMLVLDEGRHVGVIRAALGLAVTEGSDEGENKGSGALIRVSPGGLSVIEFSGDPRPSVAAVRCINNTAHLG